MRSLPGARQTRPEALAHPKEGTMATIREPADLSAVEAAHLIAKGSLSAESLMRSCLERIAGREPQVQAFEHIEGDEAPLPITGIKSMAWSLDTAGVFGRTV